MRIVVRERNGKSFSVVLPTGLLLNRATACIMPGVLEKKGVPITREQCVQMVQVIRACRRDHPGWKLVEIQSRNGDYVEISI